MEVIKECYLIGKKRCSERMDVLYAAQYVKQLGKLPRILLLRLVSGLYKGVGDWLWVLGVREFESALLIYYNVVALTFPIPSPIPQLKMFPRQNSTPPTALWSMKVNVNAAWPPLCGRQLLLLMG